MTVTLPVLAMGCSSPSEPPAPPSGGEAPELSFEEFEAEVAPILSQHGCDAGGDCHGGGIRGTLALSPRDAKDMQFDFEQVALQVSALSPTASRILTEPLVESAGWTPHSVEPFASTSDPDYQTILGWILDGVQP